MNPTLQLIHRRKSTRAFADRPIAEKEKEAIFQATFRAPTAGNMMLYSIIEVENQSLKEKLAETCDHQPFIAKAPLVLIFLADYQRWYDYYIFSKAMECANKLNLQNRLPLEGDFLLACCDALIAAQTAAIAAESLGIGSCYIGDILENYEIHREILALPRYVLPVTMLCLGYPRAAHSNARFTMRFEKEFIIHKNTYRQLSSDELNRMMHPMQEHSFANGNYIHGAENIGQHNYIKKFIADFSIEMNRSVREMIRSWS